MRRTLAFTGRQAMLIGLAILAYFGVRGLTESDPARAHRNADRVLTLERSLNVDVERWVQELVHRSELLVDLMNWIYIWGHWPVVIGTLVYLAINDRRTFFELRNAMFISGAIGLVIFAAFAVTPPRLFGVDYIDTVTIRSNAYRVLQPPALVNKYAAVPSLHFGWNLLLAVAWARSSKRRAVTIAALAMPAAMGLAVIATANHWVLDVALGGLVAIAGLAIELRRSGRSAAGRGGEPRPGRDDQGAGSPEAGSHPTGAPLVSHQGGAGPCDRPRRLDSTTPSVSGPIPAV